MAKYVVLLHTTYVTYQFVEKYTQFNGKRDKSLIKTDYQYKNVKNSTSYNLRNFTNFQQVWVIGQRDSS